MSYTLRVLFSGLCAFVPNRPFDRLEDPPTQVTVLLPNLLKPQPLDTNSPSGNTLEPHFPLLGFDLSDLHPQSQRKPDLWREASGKGACLLYGEEISLELNIPSNGHSKLTIPTRSENQPKEKQEEATPTDRESLYWLSRLDRATPKHFVIPTLLTDSLSQEDNPPLLARMRLEQGFLRVSKLSERVCRFDGSNGYIQQIATELALDIPGVEGPAAIVLRGSDGTERSLTLTPVRKPGVVEIRIENRELDDLLGIPQEMFPPRELADYQVFYKLVQPESGTVTPSIRSFPKQQPKKDGKDDGSTLKNPSLCPPTALGLAA
jgi:hypothetical protein